MATSTAVSGTERKGTDRTWTDTSGCDSLALSLVRALAAARGEDPTDLSVDLYEHVDTDALEQLAEHAQDADGVAWTLEFAVEERVVTVSSDGWVEVS